MAAGNALSPINVEPECAAFAVHALAELLKVDAERLKKIGKRLRDLCNMAWLFL